MQELNRVQSTYNPNFLYFINPVSTITAPQDELESFLTYTNKAMSGWYRSMNLKYGNKGRKDLLKGFTTFQYQAVARGFIVVNSTPILKSWEESVRTVREMCSKF